MKVDKDKCMACLMCIEECVFDAIDIDDRDTQAYKGVVINEQFCTDCNACALVCPADAIGESNG